MQAVRTQNPDRKARFEFVMPALSADPGVRERAFARLSFVENRRREPWVLELSGIIRSSAAESLLADGPPIVGAPFTDLEHETWAWHCSLTVDGLVDLAASRSHVIALEEAERERLLAEVRALGERVADAEGSILLPYRTHGFRAIVA